MLTGQNTWPLLVHKVKAMSEITKTRDSYWWRRIEAMLKRYRLVETGVVSQQEVDYLGDLPVETQLAEDEKALEIAYRILKPGDPTLTLEILREENQPEPDEELE